MRKKGSAGVRGQAQRQDRVEMGRGVRGVARVCTTTGYLVARRVRLSVENLWTGRRIGGANIERLGEAVLVRT